MCPAGRPPHSRGPVLLVLALHVLAVPVARGQPSHYGPRPLHEVWMPPVEAIGSERLATAPPRPHAETPPPRPSESAVWIGGYWDLDPEDGRFVWVPGTYRVPPPGRAWREGAWRRDERGWYRSPGFWTPDPSNPYRASGPPDTLPAESSGPRPSPLHVWIPGHYAPEGDGVAWKAGFWTRHERGWTWTPAAWLRRPEGWAFQAGFYTRDDHLLLARSRSRQTGVPGAGQPAGDRTPEPLTDAERLLRAWASERADYGATDPNAPGGPPPGLAAGGVASGTEARPGGAAPEVTAILNEAQFLQQIGVPDPLVGRFAGGSNAQGRPGTGSGFGRGTMPSPAYYVGHSLPGTSYPSVSSTPASPLGSSYYVGHSLPGTSYPSLAPGQTGTPGSSHYIGGALPGTSYPSVSPGAAQSIGNYGYGTTVPGNTGGQMGVTLP